MTDEKELEATEDLKALEVNKAYEAVQGTLYNFLSAADIDNVYGEPIQNGDTVIIPSAEVVSAVGFGLGSGYGQSEDQESGGGSGGGGGGRVFTRPVAVIVSSPEGVRVEPVVDATKIGLAALTAGAFMVGMFMRLLTPRKALKDLKDGEWG